MIPLPILDSVNEPDPFVPSVTVGSIPLEDLAQKVATNVIRPLMIVKVRYESGGNHYSFSTCSNYVPQEGSTVIIPVDDADGYSITGQVITVSCEYPQVGDHLIEYPVTTVNVWIDISDYCDAL